MPRKAQSRSDAKASPKRDIAAVLQSLETALEEVLPGLEVLDRQLAFDDGARADLAAVDAAGRLVLCLVAQDDRDRTALEVLDALALAVHDAELVARHLQSPKLHAGLEPRVILIVEPDDARIGLRLAPLVGRGLELFEVRSVRSSSGEHAYLVPVSLAGGSSPSVEGSPEPFLERLPDALAELSRAVIARMARFDDDVRLQASPDALVWSFEHAILARLENVEDRLRGGVGPDFLPRRLRGEADVEEYLEAAMGRLVQLLGNPVGPAEPRGEMPADDGLPGLLTPEEIEAFRE